MTAHAGSMDSIQNIETICIKMIWNTAGYYFCFGLAHGCWWNIDHLSMSTSRHLYEKAQQSASYSVTSLLPSQRKINRADPKNIFLNCITVQIRMVFYIIWGSPAALNTVHTAYDSYWTMWQPAKNAREFSAPLDFFSIHIYFDFCRQLFLYRIVERRRENRWQIYRNWEEFGSSFSCSIRRCRILRN